MSANTPLRWHQSGSGQQSQPTSVVSKHVEVDSWIDSEIVGPAATYETGSIVFVADVEFQKPGGEYGNAGAAENDGCVG